MENEGKVNNDKGQVNGKSMKMRKERKINGKSTQSNAVEDCHSGKVPIQSGITRNVYIHCITE